MRKHADEVNIVDPAVTKEYRRMAQERSPASLDEVVLARAEAGSSRTGWIGNRTGPIAFAAVFCLTAVVILQLTTIDTPGTSVPYDEPAPHDVVSEFDTVTTEGTNQLRNIGENASESALPSENGADALASPTAGYCAAAERLTPTAWWQCIGRLSDAGKLDHASSERARLFAAHPDFVPPD